MGDPNMEEVFSEIGSQAAACKRLDALILGKANPMSADEIASRAEILTKNLQETHMEYIANAPIENLTDEHLRSFARYTDGIPLKDYEKSLDLVPTLVNLVSLADAIPLDDSLPFSLKKIASKCRGAVYFAPRRFTAVQLAYTRLRQNPLTHASSPT